MSDTKIFYANVRVSPPRRGEVIIKAEVPADTLRDAEERAVQELGASLEIPGFRKGHAPSNLLRERLNANDLLDRAAHLALQEAYQALVSAHNLHPLTPPQIHVTKLALGSPLEFEARVGVYPDVRLPDYRKIGKAAGEEAKQANGASVSDAEVEEAVGHVLKERGVEASGLTDAFVASLGDFKDVSDFKAKLRAHITMEKAIAQHDRERDAIMKALLVHTKFDIPELAVDTELERVRQELVQALTAGNQTLEDYFKKLGKTEEQFFNEERERIANELKGQMIMQEIAEREHVAPDEATVEHHLGHLAERYPGVPRERLRAYVRTLLTYEAVFKLISSAT